MSHAAILCVLLSACQEMLKDRNDYRKLIKHGESINAYYLEYVMNLDPPERKKLKEDHHTVNLKIPYKREHIKLA